MRSPLDIFARILNRMGLLKHFNLRVPINFNGQRIIVPVQGKEGFANLYLGKDYDFAVYEFFKTDIGKGVFLDVGANMGQTLVRVKSLDRQQPIVCVEPSPACVNYLQELNASNTFNKVTIIPAALFDNNGVKKLYTRDATDTGASLNAEDRPNFFGENSFIMVNAIDGNELQQQFAGCIAFMKVDVEGEELAVLRTLRGIITRDQPIIYCEVLDAYDQTVLQRNDNTKRGVHDYMVTDLGYKIYRLDVKAKKLIAVDNFPQSFVFQGDLRRMQLYIHEMNLLTKNTLPIALLCVASTVFAQKTKQDILTSIDAKGDQYANVAHRIWEFAEVGYQEVKSSELLQEILTQSGFKIEKGVAGIPTAFIASYGSGKPVVAILAEFDALPGVSQDAVPELKPVPGRTTGHACGHHLFGTASSAAAIAVKDWMVANKKSGTIRVYGTPAEEGGSGKVYMVREGLFKDVDVVLHWHPGAVNDARPSTALANKSGKFRFHGIAAHAAGSPDRGRSALDGVEAMDNMVNMMREHVPSDTRIHYVITRGGEAPNVVPAFAEVYYYVRHPEKSEVISIWERVVKAAEGAALGTETKVDFELTGGVYNLLSNQTLAKAVDDNLHLVGGYKLDDKEKEFAQRIQKTFTDPPKLEATNSIKDFEEEGDMMGSTDVGDVSWVVPTAGLSTATWVPGTAAHSWQAVAAGGMSIGNKGMMMAAKTLAGTMIDLFEQPQLIKDAWAEFNERRPKDFKYEALVGDRKPALDYRK